MNEHKNIITIEDEIKEFSDKPVKSSALYKALEEKGVPDSSEASAGDVLSLDEDKKPTWAAPSGGGETYIVQNHIVEPFTIDGHAFDPEVDNVNEQGYESGFIMMVVDRLPECPSLIWDYYTEEATENWAIASSIQRYPASDDMSGTSTKQGFYVKPKAPMINIDAGTLVAKDSIAYGTIYYQMD